MDIRAPALNRLSPDGGAVERWAMLEPLGWVAERAGGGFFELECGVRGVPQPVWQLSRIGLDKRRLNNTQKSV